MKRLTYFSISFGLAALFTIVAIMPVKAGSASFYLSPSANTYAVSNTFSVVVKLNSGGGVINAAEGKIVFDKTRLQVVNVSKAGSLFSLWTVDPWFSNSMGDITFSGGTPAGFKGTSGTILTIIFQAKVSGTADVNFSSGSILAADGRGTNVLSSMGSGTYVIAKKEETVPQETSLLGAAITPSINSPTHPDPKGWYFNSSPQFIWHGPNDVTGTRMLVGHNPYAAPNVFYSGLVTEKSLKDLADGVWYFHVQLRNNYGWGNPVHFEFKIDTEPPEPFSVKVKEDEETSPQPTLVFSTTDALSGIDYYEIKIDQEDPVAVKEEEYKLPLQNIGKHTIIVKAVDRAGNQMLAMTEITVLSIAAPIITDYPEELTPGNILSVKGDAIPDATIEVYIQKDGEDIEIEETTSNKDGKWSYIKVDPLGKGVYQIWAKAIDADGAESSHSAKVTVLVSPPAFIRIGKIAIDYLTTIVTLLILLFAICIGIAWAWRKIQKVRKKLTSEVSGAERALSSAFNALKKETEDQVAKLDNKAGLSKREKKVCDNLKKALNLSEKFISKEIKDIKKEI